MSDLVGNPEDRFSRVAAHYVNRSRQDIDSCKHKNALKSMEFSKRGEYFCPPVSWLSPYLTGMRQPRDCYANCVAKLSYGIHASVARVRMCRKLVANSTRERFSVSKQV